MEPKIKNQNYGIYLIMKKNDQTLRVFLYQIGQKLIFGIIFSWKKLKL